ncbi:MAG: acylneuraminate cytidylyltransferase family protein [Acetobacter sp.]|nr:acylneuraminate cytidylyltransferase family protein [Acetobacter sp.]
MIRNKKILAIIPARGGSKGIPRKNIKEFLGKPLIAWTIMEAKKSQYINKCVVSTEDVEIKQVAEKWGGEVLERPMNLALDNTPGVESVIHAIEAFPNYDYVVLLQPTSPLRTVNDIDGCIKYTIDHNAINCVSVTISMISPYWMYSKKEDSFMQALLPIDKKLWYQRQKLPTVYQLNGAIYIVTPDFVKREKTLVGNHFLGYEMPKDRSYDIDDPEDFVLCEYLMSKRIDGN